MGVDVLEAGFPCRIGRRFSGGSARSPALVQERRHSLPFAGASEGRSTCLRREDGKIVPARPVHTGSRPSCPAVHMRVNTFFFPKTDPEQVSLARRFPAFPPRTISTTSNGAEYGTRSEMDFLGRIRRRCRDPRPAATRVNITDHWSSTACLRNTRKFNGRTADSERGVPIRPAVFSGPLAITISAWAGGELAGRIVPARQIDWHRQRHRRGGTACRRLGTRDGDQLRNGTIPWWNRIDTTALSGLQVGVGVDRVPVHTPRARRPQRVRA